MNVTRRRFLKLGLMAGAGIALPAAALQIPLARLGAARSLHSPAIEPFTVPLPIPPVLQPVRTDASTDYYEIVQRAGRVEILPGLTTEVWGYNGIFPGPTIEARSGRTVVVRQINELPVPVSTHLHGGMTPPDSDGYPTDLILPQGWDHDRSAHVHGGTQRSKDYTYPNAQRGATLWYHDHRMDFTGPQLYRGLAGFYLLRDEVEDALPLPKGAKDIPLMIADRIFNQDGSFFYSSVDPSLIEQPGVLAHAINGMFGDTILVNGAPWPVLEVSNTRHRFRILNASNARIYDLALDPPPPDGTPFVQVGSDGGLLSTPIAHDRLLIAPAERFDLVVDFGRYPLGTTLTLKNLAGTGRTADVMRIVVARSEREDSMVPDTLAPELAFPNPDEAEVTRRFQFIAGGEWGGMSTINLQVFDPNRIDARVRLGATEIWDLHADQDHPIHLHLVHFRVLSREGGSPGPYDAGWKDTVFLRAGDDVRVVAKFDGWRGKYLFHCHNLEHEDMMMMANFEVI